MTSKSTYKSTLQVLLLMLALVGMALMMCFTILSTTVSAQQQPSSITNKIFMSPFYKTAMTNNVNSTWTLNINPPDGMTSVSSAIISFDAYITPTVSFTIWITDGSTTTLCSTAQYNISTTYASSGQSRITFDCGNVITHKGTYTITLRPTQANTGAVSGWADITYTNNPAGRIQMHGTEYTIGQQAKLWIQLLDSEGMDVSDGVCYIDIYTPLGGQYIEGATMTNMEHDGIYYYDLPVPTLQGVYPAISECYYVATQNKRNMTTYSIRSGVLTSGVINYTTSINSVYLVFTTNKNGGLTVNNRLNVTFNTTSSQFFNNCSVSELLLTGLTVGWTGIWNTGTSNHDFTFSVYNYTSSRWVDLPNKILGGSGGTILTVSNSLSANNFTKLLGITSTNPLQIKVADNDVNEGAKALSTDYLYASCDQLSSPGWQTVKGSSEMHVTAINPYGADVISYHNYPTITYNNYSLTYYTGVFVNNFTIESFVANNETDPIEYQGFHALPCNSIQKLFEINPNGSLTDTPFTTKAQTDEGHCSINWNQYLTPGINHDFTAVARNTWESEIRSINTGVGAIFPVIDAGCKLWRVTKGHPDYITPKNQTNENYEYFYRACENFYDDYYWFNQTYVTTRDYRTSGAITDEASYLQYESDYFSLQFASNKLLDMTYLLLNNLQVTAGYSQLILQNPLGNLTNLTDNKVWANYSTTQLNWYLMKNLNTSLLNFTNNQTYNPINYSAINLTINNTAIASEVWGWSGAISDNILTQFMNKIWSAANKYIYGIINS